MEQSSFQQQRVISSLERPAVTAGYFAYGLMNTPGQNIIDSIVTGGGQGIGKTYCLGFAEEGAYVVAADING